MENKRHTFGKGAAAVTPLPSPKASLLTVLTVGHSVNDFYRILLPVLLPVIALDFGLNYAQFGSVFLATTIFSGMFQPLVDFLADRTGLQKQIIMNGFVLFAAGTALLLMTLLDGWLVVALIAFVGAAIALTFPVALTVADAAQGSGDAGMRVGLVFGISTTLSSFAPFITGLLADQFGLISAFKLLV